MPRPEVHGLKYFPFDVGFFQDKKIRLLRGEHGAEAVEVYQRLLCKCYEDNGYYLNWDSGEDYALMADDTGFTEERIQLIVSTCLRRSLFDNTLFKMGNVLTSRSIQRRYFGAVKETKMKAAAQGRHTTIRKDICLLTGEDFSELNTSYAWLKVADYPLKSANNEYKSAINSDKSAINPTKKRKEKKTILNETTADAHAREESLDLIDRRTSALGLDENFGRVARAYDSMIGGIASSTVAEGLIPFSDLNNSNYPIEASH